MGDLHGQIIDLVTGSPDELARFEQLLGWNSNLAFVSYCIEKGLVIPPDPEVAPEPSE